MIPRIFHFIWVGEEAKRPDNCIQTWRDHHPDWEVRVWGNAELTSLPWANCAHIEAMLPREFNGVADMMRWEILHAHGGVAVDADSVCVRRLEDDLLDGEAFACWENEIASPGLIAAGFVGCQPGNPFVRAIIEDIAASPTVVDDIAWKTVGAHRLTDCYRKFAYSRLRLHPSHYFMPKHFSGQEYDGDGAIYAHQLWGSMFGTYDRIHLAEFDAPHDAAEQAETAPTVTISAVQSADAPLLDNFTASSFAAGAASSATVTLPAPEADLAEPPVEVGAELAGLSRIDVFAPLCAGKRVLHVAADPQGALQAELAQVCELFTDLGQATGPYDVVLVEHVSDIADMLAKLEVVDAGLCLIDVPEAAYRPDTFARAIRNGSTFAIERMWLFDGDSILALLSKPALAMAA